MAVQCVRERMNQTTPIVPEERAAREHFARRGYAVLAALTAPALTEFLWTYVHTKFASGLLDWGDKLVPLTPSSYGDAAAEGLLAHVQDRVEAVAGRALLPTYSYLRIYKHGDVLLSHRDRPACEFSLSLNIGQVPGEPWPIYVESPEGKAEVKLGPGDALLYRGIDLFHWRERYEGHQLVQFFLHYVDADGPHAAEQYDGRPGLMIPKSVVRM